MPFLLNSPFRSLPCVAILLAALPAVPVMVLAQVTEARRMFDLPADDADRALRRFSELTGIQVMFPSDLTRQVRANAVRGEFSATEALGLMFRGTGLAAVRDPRSGALTVRREATAERVFAGPSSAAGEGSGPALRMEALEVSARRVDGLINKGLIATTEDASLPYEVITRQEIEQLGATSIEEVFRYTPQITTYSTPNQEASVSQIVGPNLLSSNLRMRGFDAQQTTVLINGRRIARAQIAVRWVSITASRRLKSSVILPVVRPWLRENPCSNVPRHSVAPPAVVVPK